MKDRHSTSSWSSCSSTSVATAASDSQVFDAKRRWRKRRNSASILAYLSLRRTASRQINRTPSAVETSGSVKPKNSIHSAARPASTDFTVSTNSTDSRASAATVQNRTAAFILRSVRSAPAEPGGEVVDLVCHAALVVANLGVGQGDGRRAVGLPQQPQVGEQRPQPGDRQPRGWWPGLAWRRTSQVARNDRQTSASTRFCSQWSWLLPKKNSVAVATVSTKIDAQVKPMPSPPCGLKTSLADPNAEATKYSCRQTTTSTRALRPCSLAPASATA